MDIKNIWGKNLPPPLPYTHVEVQKILERENHHTYWRLQLPILLNKMKKKGFAQQNINTNNTPAIFQILKNSYERVAHVAW